MIDFENKKIICICEGRFEEDLINYLLDNDKLKFQRSDLIEESTTRIRSAKNIQMNFLNRSYEKKIIILRILDSRREAFKLDKAYQSKVTSVSNIITRPEIEILVVINEGDYNNYTNHNDNRQKPSEYCKTKYRFDDVKSSGFVRRYFNDISSLIDSINSYARFNSFSRELKLKDLLRQN